MPTTQTFTTTGSWVCPTGVSSVIAECWGGGGAGGVASGTASGAGGGAGGQYAIKVVAVTPGTSYTVTVATAAAAVTTGGVVTNGSDSWFNTTGTVIAKGGAGGADATGSTGAGGAGSTTGGIGDTVFAGGSGATGVSSTQSGGGGGGAGSTGTGNSGSGATAGAAKSLNGGAGGAGVSTANAQNNGQNYGGGGSGGLSSSATNRKGGDGAPGLVVLTWDIDPSIFNFPYTNQGTCEFAPKKRSVTGMSQSPFVPPVSAAALPPFINGQSPDPGLVLSFQYQSQERPFTAATSTPALSYMPCAPVDLFNRQTRRTVQAYAGPVQVGTTTQQQTFIHGQSVDPSSLVSFQYPSTSQLVAIGGGAPESLTLDKWNAVSASPSRRLHRISAYNFALGGDVSPRVEWIRQNQDLKRQRAGLKGLASLPLVISPPETLTIDKWISQSREPERRTRRLVVYGVNCAIAKEVVPTLEWSTQQSLPRRPDRGLRDYSFGVLTIGTGPETTTPAVFIQGQSVDPQFVTNFQFESLALPLRSLAPEVITVDKWVSRGPSSVARRLFRDGWVALPQLASEQLTLDKWQQQSVFPQRRRVSVRGDRVEVPRIETFTLDKWAAHIPEMRRAQRTREGVYVIPSQPLETITINKWLAYQPVPQKDLKRYQRLFPYLAIDAAFWLVPSAAVDHLAYDRDVGIIALRMAESGAIVLLMSETRTTEMQTNNTGTIAILTEDLGVLD